MYNENIQLDGKARKAVKKSGPTPSSENILQKVEKQAKHIMESCKSIDNEMAAFSKLFKSQMDNIEELTRNLENSTRRHESLVDEFSHTGLIEFLGKALLFLFSEQSNKLVIGNKLELQCTLLEFAVECTDSSLKAKKILADIGLIPGLIRCVQNNHFNSKPNDKNINNGSDDDESGDSDLLDVVEAALTCIYNISKLPEYRSDFEKASAVEALKPYLKWNDKDVQMTAICALACLLGETENANQVIDEYGIITELVNVLHNALDKPTHRDDSGFSAEEIVESLTYLAVDDNNKQQLVDAGILPALHKMLTLETRTRIGKNELEQQRAVDCLWALAFNEEIRQKIAKTEGIVQLIETLSEKAKDESLKTKSKQALEFFKLGKNGLTKLVEPDEKAGTGHVFLSYSWKQQPTVFKIRDALSKAGYKVWIDVEQMKGSTLESMASAVEQASIVLICYSEDYLLSNMCRLEAEYTFQMKKPFVPVNLRYRYQPTGWLGIIIGSRLYVDLSEHKHPFDVSIGRLFNELKSTSYTIAGQNSQVIVPKDKPFTQHELPAGSDGCQRCRLLEGFVGDIFGTESETASVLASVLTNKKHETVRLWSKKQVADWMKTENLSHLSTRFSSFDGQALIGLYHMKFSAVHIYYKSVLKLADESFADCINLTAALDNLLNNI